MVFGESFGTGLELERFGAIHPYLKVLVFLLMKEIKVAGLRLKWFKRVKILWSVYLEMVDIFWLKVILSFIVGGSYIAFSIWISEKFGPKWGGIFISLPSTTLMGVLFIGITQNVEFTREAIQVMPAIGGFQAVFIISFILLQRFGVNKAIVGALGAWFVATFLLLWYNHKDIWTSLAIGVTLVVLAWMYLRRISETKVKRYSFSKKEFLIRAVFCGLIIATAVVLAKALGPVWGGIFASFPAATLSSLFLLSRRHGADFAISVSKSMPLGNFGYMIFVVSAYYLLLTYDLFVGIFLAYFICIVATVLVVKALETRKTEQNAV